MMGSYGMGWGAGLLGILYMLLPLLLLGLIIYWAIRSAIPAGSGSQHQKAKTSGEIAEERYARGEISAEELQTIRQNLDKR